MIRKRRLFLPIFCLLCISVVCQEEEILWEKNNEESNEKVQEPNDWINLITYKKRFSKYQENWSVKYIGFKDLDDDLILPYTLSYGHDKIKKEILENLGYKKAEVVSMGFGLDGYLKMHPGIYVGIGFGVSLGMETITKKSDSKNARFYISGELKQGIRVIPWPNLGVVIGFGFFQKVQRSKVYTTEVNCALELGINFK